MGDERKGTDGFLECDFPPSIPQICDKSQKVSPYPNPTDKILRNDCQLKGIYIAFARGIGLENKGKVFRPSQKTEG